MIRSTLVFSFFLFLVSSAASAQSAWVQEDDGHYMQLSHSALPAYNNVYLRSGGEFRTPRSILDQTIQFYGEYGLGRNTTLVYNIPVKHIHVGNFNPDYEGSVSLQAGTMWGLSNVSLGVRQKLYRDLFDIAAGFHVQAPTGMYDDSMGVRTGYDAWTFMPMLNFGKGLGNFFIQMHFGAQFRTNDYTHNLNTGVEFGHQFFGRLWVMAFLNGQISLRNGERTDPINNRATGLYLNDEEYVAFGLKLIGEIVDDRFGLTFGFGGAISGNNVAKSPSFNGGIYWNWNRASKMNVAE